MSSLFDVRKFRKLMEQHASGKLETLPLAIDLYQNPHREEERNHIEAIFERLPDSCKREIQNRLLLGDQSGYLGAWHELMVFDWLLDLEKNPVVQPFAPDGKSKPDFLIESSDPPIYIDVACVQESRMDKTSSRYHHDSPRVWWPAATHTFKTMRECLIKKMGQHPSITEVAYVVCLGLETRMIDIGEVKTCFLGGEKVNVVSRRLHSDLEADIFEKQGDSSWLVKYTNVSALLVARHDEGYRLVFGLIQNPFARIRIPETEFGALRRYVVVSETETHFEMKWRWSVSC